MHTAKQQRLADRGQRIQGVTMHLLQQLAELPLGGGGGSRGGRGSISGGGGSEGGGAPDASQALLATGQKVGPRRLPCRVQPGRRSPAW